MVYLQGERELELWLRFGIQEKMNRGKVAYGEQRGEEVRRR